MTVKWAQHTCPPEVGPSTWGGGGVWDGIAQCFPSISGIHNLHRRCRVRPHCCANPLLSCSLQPVPSFGPGYRFGTLHFSVSNATLTPPLAPASSAVIISFSQTLLCTHRLSRQSCPCNRATHRPNAPFSPYPLHQILYISGVGVQGSWVVVVYSLINYFFSTGFLIKQSRSKRHSYPLFGRNESSSRNPGVANENRRFDELRKNDSGPRHKDGSF